MVPLSTSLRRPTSKKSRKKPPPIREGARGVLAYYNFLEGLIQESVDLVYEHRLAILDACRLSIEFAIGGRGGDAAATIHSHEKALAQCSDFLKERFPNAVLKPVASTAEAARLVAESGSGLAIASRAALDENKLPVIAADIGNRRHGRRNFTDFLLVSAAAPDAPEYPHGGSYRTMVAITPRTERVGLLAEILAQFTFHNLNIAKIHSRPAIDPIEMSIEPQMFYIEVISRADGEDLRRCADALDYRYGGHSVRVLGSFPSLG